MRRFAFIDIGVPEQADYDMLLKERLTGELKEDAEKPYWKGCLDLMKKLLRQDGGGKTLHKVGLLVGPAIPLDMLRYLQQRQPNPDTSDVAPLVLEAAEMYLYPQFEGQDKSHPEILDAVADALNLDANARARTERRLRNWTGNEPDVS